jgi:hypothetical protein
MNHYLPRYVCQNPRLLNYLLNWTHNWYEEHLLFDKFRLVVVTDIDLVAF